MAVDQEEVTITGPKFLRRRDSMQALGSVCIRLVFELKSRSSVSFSTPFDTREHSIISSSKTRHTLTEALQCRRYEMRRSNSRLRHPRMQWHWSRIKMKGAVSDLPAGHDIAVYQSMRGLKKSSVGSVRCLRSISTRAS